MRIVLGGDVMLGRLVDEWLLAAGRSPFEPLLAHLHAADLVCVNLECAITDDPGWYEGPPKAFYFKARPFAAQVLADAGVRCVTLANNHALDAGVPGLRDTLRHLDAHGIAHTGAGEQLDAASRPARLDVQGRAVAVLAFCDHQADFAATAEQPGIRYLDLSDVAAAETTVVAAVRQARAQADVVLVSMHWQSNWAPIVLSPYRQLGAAMLAAGATVVWGHSPHHFQGVVFAEEGAREPPRTGAILFSTGDFVDDYAIDPSFRNDLQLLFTVDVGPAGVEQVSALPVVLRRGVSSPAEGAERSWIARTFERFCADVGTVPQPVGSTLVVRPGPRGVGESTGLDR